MSQRTSHRSNNQTRPLIAVDALLQLRGKLLLTLVLVLLITNGGAG
ncbi:hypothetical protein HDE78_003168 [Rhodanobacter sp. K2T2]|nr:hypothetical protein [Rhodanobacter sp. K2T2]NYE30200.1 hypothetical protein [Rhodanobacter sp. K2T2]